MEIMSGYKVVYEVELSGHLHSAIVPLEDGGIVYMVGAFVLPKERYGDLTCFEGLECAKNFAVGNKRLRIFDCEYEPSDQKYVWCDWGKAKKYHMLNFPPGTVLAKQIKLLKEVK